MGPSPSLAVLNEGSEDTTVSDYAGLKEQLDDMVGSLICYRLVRLSAIRHWSTWKRYQDLVPDEYVDYYPICQELDRGKAFRDPRPGTEEHSEVDSKDGQDDLKKRRLYFISHRWLTTLHPDPEGMQLRRVQNLPPHPSSEPLGSESLSAGDAGSPLQDSTLPGGMDSSTQHDPASDVLIFYDFSSLPQEPRTAAEKDTFQLGLRGLNDILSYMRVVILTDHDYMSRSWCVMEYFISSFKGSLILDEQRDEMMHQLRKLAVTPNGGVGMANSAIAEAEASRGSQMGDIAMSFFANCFLRTSVTNQSDRGSIEMVLERFIQDNIRAWTHEPNLGWKPALLQGDQAKQILRGERVRLIDLPDTGIPLLRMPTEVNNIIPQTPYEDGHDSLEPFWTLNIMLRIANALLRCLLLSDMRACEEKDMLKKTNFSG